MFSTLRQYPSLSNDLYSRPSFTPRDRYLSALAEAKAAEADYLAPSFTPRDRYLSALAEAKAAEADYLAAEAIQREEDGLRRRLEEIELQKRRSQLSNPYHSYSSYEHPHPSSYDRLSLLRHEFEEEELRRAAAVRELEIVRRREIEEANSLALKKKREEEALTLLTRRRQEEEKQLLALRQEQQLETARQVARARAGPGQPLIRMLADAADRKVYNHSSNHCQRLASHRFPATVPTTNIATSTERGAEIKGFEEVLNLLFGQPTNHSDSSKPKETAKTKVGSLKPSVHFVSDQPKASFQSLNCKKDNAQWINAPVVAIPTAQPDVAALKERLAPRLNDDEAAEVQDTIQAILASLADATIYNEPGANSSASSATAIPPAATATEPSTNSQQGPRPQTPTSSLKDQLEHRLYSDESTEIRDTIQAIFASLADAAAHPFSGNGHVNGSTNATASSSIPSSSSSSFSSKGKEKFPGAVEQTATTTSSPSEHAEPTSADVLKSMQTVQSIDAAFHALESDFVFPSQLDFTPTPSRDPSPSPSPAPSAEPSSPTSTILKLAYTSRNQPVRYYEQTLSALLTQLDGVESYGNDEVRARRKDVVGRVERALEELEEEIEGRRMSKVRKEEKEERGRTESPVMVEAEDVAKSSSQQVSEEPKTELVDVAEPDVSDQSEGDDRTAMVSQDQSNNPPSSFDDTDVMSISSESSIDPTEDEETSDDQVVEPAAKANNDFTPSSYPPQSTSLFYPPSSEPSSLSSSTTSSVATIRPYDVEPEVTPSNTTNSAETASLTHDSADEQEKMKAQKADSHTDSDWSEVEA
ncbi:hypothetical protein D9758_007349 [Tetrapyrgos nigripes]|uniref:BAG domain-containing protein n=1 Tax=Tetrapyrgos nigripes TaxID=182062 RepID=A0A8H5LLJ8_9AGAR|nr:hypothetical protein D9758_007349 [Tetrapyrgos nigripes]